MTKKILRERWEERIIRITEVIDVDDEGNQVGDVSFFSEDLKEVTDSGDIHDIDWEDINEDHWVKRFVKNDEELENESPGM